MIVKNITDAIEAFAPLATQEGFDNSGLIVGDPYAEVHTALLCVDVTEAVIDEAASTGADLVVSHHPLIFNPVKRLTGATYVERVVAAAIRNNIAVYACHTNLDAAPGGLSRCLADLLGLRECYFLSPAKDGLTGFGMVGQLPEPTPVMDFLASVAEKLNVKVLRHSAPVKNTVRKIALSSGSGASFIPDAVAAGADVYIAADFKYNNFLDAAGLITVVDAGHYETEFCAIDLLYAIIRKKFPTFALRKSVDGVNPVNYFVNN